MEPPLTVEPQPKTINWKLIGITVAIAGWLLSGFFVYSKKKTTEEFRHYVETHSDSITIHEPISVGGRIVYRDIFRTITSNRSDDSGKKTQTTWKSGVGLGAVYSITRNEIGGYINPDLISFGPGTVQAFGLASKSEIMVGAGYRILF